MRRTAKQISVRMTLNGMERSVGTASGGGDDVGYEFADFYRRSYASVLAATSVALGWQTVAEDSTCEAFARALENWHRVRNLDHPIAWTTRVALNHGRRALRRASIERRLLMASTQPVAEPPAELSDLALWAAVLRLPLRQRTAIALRYVEHLSQAEVADRMGIRTGTAGALLTQGRRSLRESIADDRSGEKR
jgi:RNA polymerase sigma-70 factor (ECF subfamily)